MTTFLSDIVLAGANDIQFKNTSGANTGKIESDGNNLVLSNAVGDILLGDGASDVYIGDGTNNVNILFEQSGSIKAEDGSSGVTLTLGSGDTTLALGSSISSAATVLGALTVGVDDTGHDVRFYGATSGANMLWDESEDGLVITHPAGDAGLEIYTVSGTAPSSPQFKVGRNTGEYFAVYTEDRTAHLIHRQDETDSGAMYTSSELWGGGSGNDSWTWKHGTNTGGSLATVMTLDKAGQLTVTGEIEGGSLDINGNADISGNLTGVDTLTAQYGRFTSTGDASVGGTTHAFQTGTTGSTNIIIDNNEIMARDNGAVASLNLNPDGGNVNFHTNTGNTSSVSASGNATFAGSVTATSLDINGAADISGNTQLGGTLTVGVDDTGHDVKFFGATSGRYLLWDESADSLEFTDNAKAVFGIDNDMKLYHDASNSYITANGTGHLYIMQQATDADISFQSDDGSGGNAEYLRIDGGDEQVKVFKNLTLDDNIQAWFGSGNDLRIYHDASNSHIYANGTGNIVITQDTADQDIILKCDDGSGGNTAYLTLDGSAGHTVANKEIQFLDSVFARFGTGDDFKIHHDGTNTLLVNNTGSIFIDNYADNAYTYFRNDDGAGGIATYFFLSGPSATHDGSSTTNLYTVWPDLSNITLGSSQDFSMKHDGTDTIFNNQTGNFALRNSADDKDIIFQCDDGSGGVATYLTIDGSEARTNVHKNMLFDDSVTLGIGASYDLQLYHNGSTSLISNQTGNLYLRNQADDGDIIIQADDGSGGDATYMTFDGGIASILTYRDILMANDGNDGKIKFGASQDLSIYHDGSNSYIDQTGTGNLIIRNTTDDADIIFQSDDGSGGVTAYLTLDGSEGYTVANKNIRFQDNIEARFGSGNDMKLFHTGAYSMIQNLTGDLFIQNVADDKDIIFQSDDGSGGVETYFFLDGSQADGTYSFTIFPDNSLAAFGDSTDLQIYHDGTNTKLLNYTGDLQIINYADDKDIIFQSDDGSGGTATYFYLDGSSATNIFSKDVLLSDNISLKIGNAADMKLYHDGSNSYINQQGTGDLYLRQNTDDGDIIFQSDDGSGGLATYLTLDGSAAETKVDKDMRFSDNVNLRIGTNSDVVIVHDNSNFTTTNYTGNYNIINQQVDGDIVFQTDDGSGGVETYLTIDGGSQEIIATKPIVTGESQIKVLPHHFMSNEDGGANKSAQFRDDTIIGVRTSADSAELYAFVEIPYGKTARTVTVYGNDTSLVVNVYESDINAGALTDKTPGAGCVVGTACDITDVAYSATNYLVIKVTTVSYTNDIVYGAVVTIG